VSERGLVKKDLMVGFKLNLEKTVGYRIRRVDENQKSIVQIFRSVGAKVFVLSEVGKGCPDILIGLNRPGRQAFLHLVEIKNDKVPPSGQRLTKDELNFHNEWNGFVSVVRNEKEAMYLIEQALKGEI
jgi:hypothetical protein